jgi:hypothetical protein
MCIQISSQTLGQKNTKLSLLAVSVAFPEAMGKFSLDFG